MHVLIAPDSFKESLSALEVSEIIKSVLKDNGMTCTLLPVADGGEGTTESLINGFGGTWHTMQVCGPMGDTVTAQYGIAQTKHGRTAVIEMATASGLMLVAPENRNPMVANTYGLGELMNHALRQNIDTLIMGIGGSATNDGGTGMLMAMGVHFVDKDGVTMPPSDLPRRLQDITHIDSSGLNPQWSHVNILVACDVDNPLLGNTGATAIYGPQKGVSPATAALLELGLAHYAQMTALTLGGNHAETPGTGAAGGMGFALLAYLKAHLQSGVDLVLDVVDFDTHVQKADIVITGEGKIDNQTINGKTPAGVAKRANIYGKPTYILAGTVETGWENLKQTGVCHAYAITPPGQDLPNALKNARHNLKEKVKEIVPYLKSYKTHSESNIVK